MIKRGRLIQEDSRVHKTFYRACLPVLKKARCVSEADYAPQGDVSGWPMSTILRCLMDYQVEAECECYE